MDGCTVICKGIGVYHLVQCRMNIWLVVDVDFYYDIPFAEGWFTVICKGIGVYTNSTL